MEDSWGRRLSQILPVPGNLLCTPAEAHALLEVAYLAMSIDQETNELEVEAFRGLSARLKSLVDPDAAPPSEMDVATVLATFRERAPVGRERTRIREVGTTLGADPVRWLAYQIAFAMTLIDFATSEEEIAIDETFREALAIDDARAEALRKEVYAKLEG